MSRSVGPLFFKLNGHLCIASPFNPLFSEWPHPVVRDTSLSLYAEIWM